MKRSRPDITLVVCPPISCRTPHIGAAYLAGAVEQQGLRPRVVDLNLGLWRALPRSASSLWDRRHLPYWLDRDAVARFLKQHEQALQQQLEQVLQDDPPWVGLSVQMASFLTGMAIVERLKQMAPELKVVLGGGSFYVRETADGPAIRSHAFPLWDEPERLRQLERWLSLIDVIVFGEGEATLIETLQVDRAGGDTAGLAGTGCYRDGRHIVNPPRPLIEDLDDLAVPAYHLFPLREYESDSLPLLASRGCPMRCAFCTERQIWGCAARRRSAENVVHEIRDRVSAVGTRTFDFVDMSLNSDLGWLARIAEGLLAAGLEVGWSGNMIVKAQMDRGYLEHLAAAGARSFALGIESGSSRVLRRMRKAFSVEDAEDVLRRCQRAGIRPRINVMVGLPRETETDFQRTCRFLAANRPNIASVDLLSICTVFRDSDLGREPGRFGILPETIAHIEDMFEVHDWVDTNGLTFAVRHERFDRALYHLEDIGLLQETAAAAGPDGSMAGNLTEEDRRWLAALPANTTRMSLACLVQGALGHGEPAVRVGGLRLVGALRGAVFLDDVHRALADQDPAVQREAAATLGILAHPDSLDPRRGMGPWLGSREPVEVEARGRLRALHDARVDGGKVPQTGTRPPAPDGLRIEEVTLRGAGDGDESGLITGREAVVTVSYAVSVPLTNPVLQCQVFSDDPAWGERLVFGTHSHRGDVYLGTREPGDREVTVTLRRLNLMPGDYHLKVHCRPSEPGQRGFRGLPTVVPFSVGGDGPPDGTLADMPTGIADLRPASDPGPPERDALQLLEHVAGASCASGDPLTLRLGYAVAGPAPASLMVSTALQGHCVHRTVLSGVLPGGRGEVDVSIASVNLLAGSYRVTVALLPPGGGRSTVEAGTWLAVHSGFADGAGVVYNPATWSAPQSYTPEVVLTGITLVGAEGQPRAEVDPGEPLTLVIRYTVRQPVDNPVIRCDLLTWDPFKPGEVLVQRATTADGEVFLGTGEPGEREAHLHFPRLALAPGHYWFAVGLWPADASSSVPFDVLRGGCELRVRGEPGPPEEPGSGAGQPVVWHGAEGHGADVRLTGIEIQDDGGQGCSSFRVGAPLVLDLAYSVRRPVPPPLLRCQLFTLDDATWDRTLIFGTNTDRAGLRLQTDAPGEGRVRLRFPRLQLAAGRYQLTVGLWPDASSAMAFDVRHGAVRFEVRGEAAGADDALAPLPLRAGERRPADGPPTAGGDGLRAWLVDVDGACRAGETLRLRLAHDIGRAGLRALGVGIQLDGRPVCRGELPAPTGRGEMDVVVGPLELLAGSYVLEVSLLGSAPSAAPLTTVHLPLSVQSDASDGAGVVRLAVEWSADPTGH